MDEVRTLAKTTVITRSATSFTGAACADLPDGNEARVTGTMATDGGVTASTVEFVRLYFTVACVVARSVEEADAILSQ
ncbi:MAG: hypothetical protein ACE148_01125 [Vicinamibacterales bacterium]